MTYAEVVNRIKRMSRTEQQALYNELRRTLSQPARKQVAKAMDFRPGKFKPAKNSSLFLVLGALREEGKPAPTDDEVERMIADYLIEKHS